MRAEATARVAEVLRYLESWQQIVSLRMHDNLTFQQIADQLEIPSGNSFDPHATNFGMLRKI